MPNMLHEKNSNKYIVEKPKFLHLNKFQPVRVSPWNAADNIFSGNRIKIENNIFPKIKTIEETAS